MKESQRDKGRSERQRKVIGVEEGQTGKIRSSGQGKVRGTGECHRYKGRS